jgi:hypothetical protein
VLVLKFASHPFAALPSQLPNPGLHTGTQLPAEQVVVPFALVHAPPHEPQLAWLVWVLVSQPFVRSPSQLPNPESHEIAQAPLEQLAVPFALLHFVPQLPQFATLEPVFTSQPFVDTLSQLAKPELQVDSVHVPVEHDAAAFGRLQDAPQAPQLVSVVSAVSQPLAEFPSQSPRPLLQLETPQVPPTQFGVPPAAGHTCPQVPQLVMLVAVLVSHPFRALPSQSPNPAAQVGTHAPAVHAVLPFELVQATPQAPQFDAVLSGVSQPFFGLPSQSP